MEGMRDAETSQHKEQSAAKSLWNPVLPNDFGINLESSTANTAGGAWASCFQVDDTFFAAIVIPSPMAASQKTVTTAY